MKHLVFLNAYKILACKPQEMRTPQRSTALVQDNQGRRLKVYLPPPLPSLPVQANCYWEPGRGCNGVVLSASFGLVSRRRVREWGGGRKECWYDTLFTCSVQDSALRLEKLEKCIELCVPGSHSLYCRKAESGTLQ